MQFTPSNPADRAKFERHVAKAEEAMSAGFQTKAAQKAAIDSLSRAYEVVRAGIARRTLDVPREARTEAQDAVYWDLPASLAGWRPKHADMVLKAFPDAVRELQVIAELVAKRDQAKGMEVSPVVKPVDPVEVATKALEDEITRRASEDPDYDAGAEISRRVSLPVGAIPFGATSVKGRFFTRWKYYLAGRVTALNTILAIAEMLRLEAEGQTAEARQYEVAIEAMDSVALHIARRFSGRRSSVDQSISDIRQAKAIEQVVDALNVAGKARG